MGGAQLGDSLGFRDPGWQFAPQKAIKDVVSGSAQNLGTEGTNNDRSRDQRQDGDQDGAFGL